MKIAIIGAGVSGIAAARTLIDRGCDVTVFEKSRGWGGRCASKRIDQHVIDHGAQYFTLRDPAFRMAVEVACADNLLKIAQPILDQEGREVPAESPRFYHRLGNSRLARDLGHGVDVRTESPVPPVSDLTIDGVRFDHILSTAPLPQTLKLAKLDDPAPESFSPCLCLILLCQGRDIGKTSSHYAFSNKAEDSPVAWTACENHKVDRIRGDFTGIVVHASQSFSLSYLENEPEVWVPILRKSALQIWDISAQLVVKSLSHRWRYARNFPGSDVPELPAGWTLGGDSLSESRVESAWLSGRRAAESVLI